MTPPPLEIEKSPPQKKKKFIPGYAPELERSDYYHLLNIQYKIFIYLQHWQR